MAGVVVAAVVVTALVVTVYWRIHTTGRIKTVGVGVYSDAACTIEVSAIDWGSLAPGDVAESSLYMKNTGNQPVNVTLSTEAWSPAAAEAYLVLTWNFDGHTLAPGEVVPVTFKLTVKGTIVGVTEFSFDIIITAEG